MTGRDAWEGLPLHVDVRGRGRPVLLLHGYAASSFSFREWIPELARRYRVVAVDLKGFGRAPKPDDGRYAPADLAEPVGRLIIAMDLRGLVLVGHSLGGGVALLTALELLDSGEGGRLAGLVSVSGIAYPQRLPPFARLAARPRLARALLAVTPKRLLVRHVLRSVVHEPRSVHRAQVEGYARPLRSAAARRSLVAAGRQIVPPELATVVARYADLDVPALLLRGRQDRVVPAEVGRRLHRALPRSVLHVLESCGHLPAEERPRESLRRVQEFLDGL